MEEIYKTIDGFENYEVSNFGNVKNKITGLIFKQRLSNMGYYYVFLYKNKKGTNKKIHRLVCQAFLENPENKDCVDHKNGNKLNNNIENLRWCTLSENQGNRQINKNNKSGFKGVNFHKPANKWCARICIDGIHIHLGLFDNIEDARDARVKAANAAFGVFLNSCEKS